MNNAHGANGVETRLRAGTTSTQPSSTSRTAAAEPTAAPSAQPTSPARQRVRTDAGITAEPERRGDHSALGAIGVNVIGLDRPGRALETICRSHLPVLDAMGIPMAINDVDDASTELDLPHRVNLVCIDPGMHYAMLERTRGAHLDGHYTVGLWTWDTDSVPEHWDDLFAWYDEIWVPGTVSAEIIAAAAPIPVVSMPVRIDTESTDVARGRSILGSDDGEFTFLALVDMRLPIDEQHPFGVVDAFRHAFLPSDGVRLVIRCAHAQAAPATFQRLCDAAHGHAITVDAEESVDDTRDAIAACDAFVALHRFDAMGLDVAEAIAGARPVIATTSAAAPDLFAAPGVCWVRGEIHVGAAGRVHRIEASIEDAAAHMQRLASDPVAAEQFGLSAREAFRAIRADDRIARRLMERLETIGRCGTRDGRLRDARSAQDAWDAQLSRLAEIIASFIPEGATAVVATGGRREHLPDIPGATLAPFPQLNGRYADIRPADEAAVIELIESTRSAGAQYLVIPASESWWFAQYPLLEERIEEHYVRIWNDETCIVFQLGGSSDGTRRDDDLQNLIRQMASRIEELSSRETQLREMLEQVQSELRTRDSDPVPPPGASARPEDTAPRPEDTAPRPDPLKNERPEDVREWVRQWQQNERNRIGGDAGTGREATDEIQLLSHIQMAVRASVPEGATIVVASGGDGRLVDFEERTGWHFPQDDEGLPTQFYPDNSGRAILAIEKLRAMGGDFLLIPSAAFWIFDHYGDLREHLDGKYRHVWDDETCVIFEMTPPADVNESARSQSSRIRGMFGRRR